MLGSDAVLDLTATSAVIFTDPWVKNVGLSKKIARVSGFELESLMLGLETRTTNLGEF